MDIGDVLKKAWGTIWNHKVLWIFGILAGCGASGDDSSNFRYSFRENFPLEFQQNITPFENIPDWSIALIVAAIILLIFTLVVLTIVLNTIGQIGLIKGTQQVDENDAALSLVELLKDSAPYFWHVLGLRLIVGLTTFLFVSAVVLLGIFGSILTLGFGALCFIPLLCLLPPVIWAVNIIIKQVIIAIISEDLDILAGLRRGWEVVTANVGSVAVMALILSLGINIIGGFIIALPLVFIVGPALIGVITGENLAITGGFIFSLIGLIVYIPILFVLKGILQSYIESAWTLTYLRLASQTKIPVDQD